MLSGTRILSVWLPRLSVNRYGRTGIPVEEVPFAVTRETGNAVGLHSVNKTAAHAGLLPGMTLSAARATVPELLTLPYDHQKDELFLMALQRLAERFSPWSTVDHEDGILINITGCARLFGGEAALLKLVKLSFEDLQVEAHIGIADTKGAARAVARFAGDGPRIISPGEGRKMLARYPIEALLVDEKTTFELKRLGLKSIGDLYALNCADIARRFGFALLRAYEKLFGSQVDPVVPAAPRPVFSARMTFPDPIGLQEDIDVALHRLAEQVCSRLKKHEFGTRGVRLTLMRADHRSEIIEIGLARPVQEARPILQQFQFKLGKADIGEGLEMIRLVATQTEPFKPVQQTFAAAETCTGVTDLISTLGNRLGFDRVTRWRPVSSHLPRQSYSFVEASLYTHTGKWQQPDRPRPLLFVDFESIAIIRAGRPPKQFTWRNKSYCVSRFSGPERISPAWWQALMNDVTVDYWHVQTIEGPSLWLSTRPGHQPQSWSVAGVFP